MSNLNRIQPRDGERIDEESCPDCFHAKDECVCELDFPVPVLASPTQTTSGASGEARESKHATRLSRRMPCEDMVPLERDSRGGENICEEELCDWLDNLPKPPEPLPYYMRTQKQITDRSPFE
jgi:hypothetical protein